MEGQTWKEMPIPAARDDEYREVAWAKPNLTDGFQPVFINRPKVSGNFVKFAMKYCGVCHSDVHIGNNDLKDAIFPIVPGHELCGVVTEIGDAVTKVKVGDNVGVGCIVDACLDCEMCSENDEMLCLNGGSTHTYNTMKGKYEALGKTSHCLGNREVQNFGGYSGSQVVHEHFIIRIPDSVPLENAGPIMCAGATMYTPLKHWGYIKDYENGVSKTVGVVGLGGLGTMGVKLAKAMGHKVVVISTSANKEAAAKEKGADIFVVSTNEESMKANANQCDIILNTVSAGHQAMTYIPLLRSNGVLVQLGLVNEPHTIPQMPLMFQRKSIAGSLIGGIKDTEDLLKFCGEKQVLPDIQLIEASGIDQAWAELLANSADGKRFVIDIEKSKLNADFMPKE